MRFTAGSCFGDNLAPISDTTIASSLSREVDVMKVVRSRFKYALIAGAISVVGYPVFGFMDAGNGVSAEMAAVDATYASSIVFLIIPVRWLC